MKYVAFVTDGEIDLRSFSTFGFNAKPNTTSPIGFFGTGLKIATAILARLGCKMIVIINGVQHEFYTKPTNFRGKEFNVVHMRKRKGRLSKWQYQEMPYTTELGKNWKPWQVFRELESNTRDENGETLIIEDESPFLSDEYKGKTVILVSEPGVIKAYEERDTIFLPPNLEVRTETHRCQAFNVESKYLFYRGIRVVEFDRPSAFTYNILAEQQLTEDRTIYDWRAQWEIRSLIMQNEDADFIEQVIKLEDEKFWEGRIEFDDIHAISSEKFRSVVRKLKSKGSYILPRVATFYDRYNVQEPVDPYVTITLKKSEWVRVSQVLNKIDTDEIIRELGWENFEPFEEFMYDLSSRVPMENLDEQEIPF